MTTPTEPWIYCWPQSVSAGDTVALRAAGPPAEAEVRVHRTGRERQLVWTGTIQLAPHDIPETAASAGCGWPDAAAIEVEDGWQSGYYEVRMRTRAGFRHDALAFFVVRASTVDPNRPLMVLTTNTWNAYNDFGGRNLYMRGTRVSFERPLAPGLLFKPSGHGERVAVVNAPDHAMLAHRNYVREHGLTEWAGSAGWPNAELGFVRWAEGSGYELDFAVNADLALVPGLLDGRRLYLSVGHDEYWSWEMRDAVETFTKAGGNAAFLSGNTSFWQVRFEDDGATMVGYKDQFRKDPVFGSDRQHLLTSMWSDHLIGRPENQMTGVSFSRGGYHRIGRAVGNGAGGYTVYRPEHWVFAGTDVVYGDVVGAGAVTVGYECDGCELTFRDGLPYPTHSDGTPENFEILGLVPARPFGRDNSPRGVPDGARSECEFISWRVLDSESPEDVRRFEHGHAVMGLHRAGEEAGADPTAGTGGTVFTAGTTEWAWGVTNGDKVIEQITRNLLDTLGAPSR
jgi:hypothetical protein